MHDLISQFGIDWKLLIAQVVNFFILLFLLKRYAYKPVMDMLTLRRRKIEEGMKASEASKKKLEETEETQKQILLHAHEDALTIIDEASKKADEQAHHILLAAQSKGEQVVASGQKHIEEERAKLADEIEASAEDLIRASLVKVIGKIEPQERDRQLIQEALRELKIVSKAS